MVIRTSLKAVVCSKCQQVKQYHEMRDDRPYCADCHNKINKRLYEQRKLRENLEDETTRQDTCWQYDDYIYM